MKRFKNVSGRTIGASELVCLDETTGGVVGVGKKLKGFTTKPGHRLWERAVNSSEIPHKKNIREEKTENEAGL